MQFPVAPEDVKIVQGASGRGLQVTCTCGCVNWNHIEMQSSLWKCRNCGQIISDYYPGLVVKALQLEKAQAAPEAAPATS
jgi:hypothetical protein